MDIKDAQIGMMVRSQDGLRGAIATVNYEDKEAAVRWWIESENKIKCERVHIVDIIKED